MYTEKDLNDATDEIQKALDKAVMCSNRVDGDDQLKNVLSALSVGFHAIIGYAHDRHISLFDVLKFVEKEANFVIDEVRKIQDDASEVMH